VAALRTRGDDQFKAAKYQEALKTFQQVCALDTNDVGTYFRIANAASQLGDRQTALMPRRHGPAGRQTQRRPRSVAAPEQLEQAATSAARPPLPALKRNWPWLCRSCS